MKRCLHDRKRSHTFKNGDVMWLCLDCGAGGGHEDQSVPSQGNLYRKGGVIADAPESDVVPDTTDDPEEADEPEIAVAELSVPTFAALEEAEVPEQPGEEDGEEVEEVEEIEA